MAAGESRKDAVRSVAHATGIARNRVYEVALAASE